MFCPFCCASATHNNCFFFGRLIIQQDRRSFLIAHLTSLHDQNSISLTLARHDKFFHPCTFLLRVPMRKARRALGDSGNCESAACNSSSRPGRETSATLVGLAGCGFKPNISRKKGILHKYALHTTYQPESVLA